MANTHLNATLLLRYVGLGIQGTSVYHTHKPQKICVKNTLTVNKLTLIMHNTQNRHVKDQ